MTEKISQPQKNVNNGFVWKTVEHKQKGSLFLSLYASVVFSFFRYHTFGLP